MISGVKYLFKAWSMDRPNVSSTFSPFAAIAKAVTLNMTTENIILCRTEFIISLNANLQVNRRFPFLNLNFPKEPLINCLCGRIAAFRGARNLDYPFDMSRLLRSVRLALHPAQKNNQRFHNPSGFQLLIDKTDNMGEGKGK